MPRSALTAAMICLGSGMVIVPASALHARITVSEITGTWSGSEGKGPDFLARLTHIEDEADLRIWNGADAVPDGSSDPDLEAIGFAPIAFATSQRLELLPGPDGTLLQLVTEFADEEAEGREVVQIRFSENRFTVVGYHSRFRLFTDATGSETVACDVDLLSGKVTELGKERLLPALTDEDRDASGWRINAAFDRGWCLE